MKIEYKHVQKVVKDQKKAGAIWHHLKSLDIQTLDRLDNLPRHGATIAGYSTHLLVSQLREVVILAELSLNEEEEE